MSRPLHLTTNKVPGHGPSYSPSFSCLGVLEKKTVGMQHLHSDDSKLLLHWAGLSLRCSSRKTAFICKAGSNNQRRNPDFNGRKSRGFYRNRNIPQTEDFDSLTSKNGPLHSLSNNTQRQATAIPGPRDLEVLELFRKVQAKLRERESSTEEKIVEASIGGGQNKENETVDSVLELLRKHSVDKVNGRNGSRIKFDPNQQNQNQILSEGVNRDSFNFDRSVQDDSHNIDQPLHRPASNFWRRSPVPQVRYEPTITPKGATSAPSPSLGKKSRNSGFSSNLDYDQDLEIQPGAEIDQDESQLESSYIDEEMTSEILEINGSAELEESHLDNAMKDEKNPITTHRDLSSMKLQELKAIAKAQGMKGYSKLKKSELIGILSGDQF